MLGRRKTRRKGLPRTPRKTPRRLKVQRVVQKASRRVGRMKVSARVAASLPAGPSCVWFPVRVPWWACHSRHLCTSLSTARALVTAVARSIQGLLSSVGSLE